MSSGELILYQTDDGQAEISPRAIDDTVWLTQDDIAALFDKGRSTIAEHIQNIFSDGELIEDSVCRKFRQTVAYCKNYNALHYKEAEDGELIEHSVVKESLTTASEEEDNEALEKMAKDIESWKKGIQDERS